jgi:hypothetical protein
MVKGNFVKFGKFCESLVKDNGLDDDWCDDFVILWCLGSGKDDGNCKKFVIGSLGKIWQSNSRNWNEKNGAKVGFI